MSVEITCILNVFKRVEYFEDQLNAILNQSIPPKKIIIWNNNSEVNMSSYATDNILVLNSSQNLGVWARFFSQYFLLSGEYVCIFDDDTIPGCNWFKNCVETINKYNALLGTIGVIFDEGDTYKYNLRYGWSSGCDNAKMVDIVGHSWFFRKEWITTFIKELPNIDQKYLTCGEDIHLSYVLQKYLNIPTIVPPHPWTDITLWGADNNKSWKYGKDENALCRQPGWHIRYNDAFKNYISNGFETIHNKAKTLKTYSNCLDYFIARIKNKQHFVIMKCADGEYSISINKSIQNCDNWTFKTDSILHKHFNDTLSLINSNVFYGVSGPSDSKVICDYWYKNIANTHNITYANIFVNKNYSRWEEFLKNAEYNCILISQVYPSSGKLGGMKIIEYLPIDKYLVNKWDDEYENYFKLVSELARNHTNLLFFVSAGPLANIFIHRMYLENPNNTYIDCGSSIDFLTKGIYTRTYQTHNDIYVDKENLPIVYGDLQIIENKNIHNFEKITQIQKDFVRSFKGGWSYTQKEITELLKNLSLTEDYSVLEFGSGDSTIKLHNYIKKYTSNLIFYTYESDINYIRDYKEIQYILYDINNIKEVVIPDIKFDLILIDGPNGDKRSLWYSKIKKNVKNGTIILIDDFNHYKCFSEELDKNFEYETLSYNDEPFIPNGEHSWKIIKITGVRAKKVKDNFEIAEFRFLTTNDEYDVKYEWWSRIYEYKVVLNVLENLNANAKSLIHNTSWGFTGCHLTFKNDLDSKYEKSIHSDIKSSSIKNTMIYDITKPISSSFHNYFDFVINISTVEEVNYPTDKILDNLMQQLKPNGYLIITFDYDINNCTSVGNGSMNLSLIENYLNKNIESMPTNAINGSNVVNPMIRYTSLNCGILVIKKI